MDYSENITQSFKYEPQEYHFNKKQYSLHCTVKHEEDRNKYFYHFSDELTHNFAFTQSVVEHLIKIDPELEIIRIKSDNCSTQYKSKNVFGKYKQLASEKGISVICYYGVSGHGKGLVDAMSGFGAKGPLRKAVVTQDLHYDCASNIVSFLKDPFINDNQKQHFELESKEIQSVTTIDIKIKDCRKQHKIVFSLKAQFR